MATRDIAHQDLDWVLKLNTDNEEKLSPLDSRGLWSLIDASYCALATTDQAGFMVAFDHNCDYGSPNFLWFKDRYPQFVYVDRIAVCDAARGQGIARRLYEALFHRARADHLGFIGCEVNMNPPNPGSDAFHARMGFVVTGQAQLDGDKCVRYWGKKI